MEDNFLINRFMEDLTPRRAIARFAEIATPVDSPDPSTLVQIPQERPILPDATPAIGSSQSSLRSGILKRKLETQEQAGVNVSKRSMVEIPESELLDSILNDSELPSQVGSPDVVIPRHRAIERRVSTSHLTAAFSQAIQSQESQPSTAAAAAGNDSDDDSLPFELASPVLNPRLRSRKKISESIFKKPLESLNREASDEDSDGEFPPEVPSPEVARPPSRTRSRNDSGSQYQGALSQEVSKPIPEPDDDLIEDNGSEDTMPLSDLSTDEIGARTQPFADRIKKKVSMGPFTAVLNQQQVAGPTDSESLESSIEDLGDELTSQRPGERSRKRASSNLYKEVLSQKVDDKPVPSDVELSPVRSTHSSIIGFGGDGQEHSPIPISSSSASVVSRKNSSESDDVSSLDLQQPELDKSKRASSSRQISEEEVNEKSSNEEEDEELQHKEKSAAEKQRRSSGRKTPLAEEAVDSEQESRANQRQSGSTGRRTPSTNQRQHEFDSPLSGPSTLQTPELVIQPKTKSKPKVSSTPFDNVLEEKADEEVPPQKEKSAAYQRQSGSNGRKTPLSSKSLEESDGSLSGPSTLETPEQVKEPKTLNKPKISATKFDQVLEEIYITSDEEVPLQKETVSANQRQSGSTGRRTPSSNTIQHESDGSLSGPSTLETPEQVRLPISKNTRSRVSNTDFLKVLEGKAIASDEEVSTQQEKSSSKARQSEFSGRKTPPSNKSSESDSSLVSSPEQPKGGVSLNRTPSKSPATNGVSGRKSVPQTAGPLEARESQQQEKSRETRQSRSSGRKTPSSEKSNSLPSSPEQEKQPKDKNSKLRASTSNLQKVVEEKAVDSDDELLSSQKGGKISVGNRRSGSTGRKTPLANKGDESDGPSSLDSPEKVEQQPKTKRSTRLSSAQVQENVEEVVEEDAIPQEARAASKRKTRSTGRRTPLSNKSQHESDIPEQVEQPNAKKTRSVSSSQALEEKGKEPEVATESDSNKSFHGWTPQNPTVVQETLLHKSRTSFVQPDALSTSSRESAPTSKTVSAERSVFKRVYGTDAANLDDSIDSPSATNKSTGFVPLASSTQMPKKALEEDFEEEEEESVAQTVNFSQKSPPVEEASNAVSLSMSDLPEELDSPPKRAAIPRRSERSSAKKRQSMTEYLAALGPRNTPPKAKTPTSADGVSPRRTPAKSPPTNRTSGKKSVAPPPSVDPGNITAPPLEASGNRESLSVSNRTRRSLKFNLDDPEVQDIMSKIQYLRDDPVDVDAGPPSADEDSDEVVEETPSSGDLTEEEEERVEVQFEAEEQPVVDYQPDDMEEGDENDPDVVTPIPSSGANNRSSKKSSAGAMSPPSSQRFNIKNSTVIADGGIPFSGGALSMSPISAGSGSAIPTVQSTPSTPPRANKKPIRSVPQSPLFMSVMQKVLTKQTTSTPATSGRTTPEDQQVQPPPSSEASPGRVSPVERPIEASKPKTVAPAPSTSGKGASRANPLKGKSMLTLPVVEEAEDDSDSEWEDEPVSKFDPSILLQVASKPIVDRTKNFIPLEQRLKADPIFQAKVKLQKEKNAAEKAAADAAAAKKKLATPKKTRAPRKKVDDNITNVATNKANLKFYARTKVTKEALESIHELVGEWFDFTLDQLEIFLEEEGKDSLETWEDCAKMLRKQGIAKNYMEYSGLINEVMTPDESVKLLPQNFPPGHEEAKLEAKRNLAKK